MSLILFILHDPEKLHALLDAWSEAGVSGATVFFSTGMGRIQQELPLRDDLPPIPSLEDFLPKVDRMSRTVFSVVDDDEIIEKVIDATQQVVGDLDDPDRGLFIVLPISRVYGFRKDMHR
jgi:nitrogen regulatory protein P-II 1